MNGLVHVIDETRVSVVTVAVKGDKGEPGEPGNDVHYTHVQSSPAATWVVVHALGKHPAVTVVDSAGTVVEGDVTYNSPNQVTISFSAAFSGAAYFN